MKNAPALAIVLRKYHPLSSIFLGSMSYLVGLAICYSSGATSEYFNGFFFPTLCIGIILVAYHYVWGFNHLDEAVNEIGDNFHVPKEEFKRLKQSYLKRMNSDKMALIATIPGLLLDVYGISLFPSHLLANIPYISFTAIAACFGYYLILAPIYMVICSVYFLNKVTSYPAKLHIMQKKNRLQLHKFLTLNLRLTLVWFLGFSLLLVNFWGSGYIGPIGLLVVLSIGIVLFLIPQLLFRRAILHAKENLLTEIESELLSKTTIPLSSKNDPQQSLFLYMLFERTERISAWTLNTEPLVQLFLYAIIPVLTTIIGILIK